MRLTINLATQPYEVARGYKRRMTLTIAALGIVAVLLVGYIVYQRAHTRSINRQLANAQQQIDGLDREETQARAILNKPANRVIADQSDFLNDLFARKSLSWTRIFSELEKIIPADLHVVSMKPEYTKTNDLVLHVIVATDSRDRAVELVRHMEKSNHFRQAQVVAESVVGSTSAQSAGPASNIQFDIAAVYVPGTFESDDAADGAAGKTTAPTPPTGAAASQPPASGNAAHNASPAAVAQCEGGTESTDESWFEGALMASIRETRKKLMPAVIALAVLDLACIGYLLSPAGRSRQARQQEYDKLHQQLLAKQQEVLPTRGMDQKLQEASQDITAFYGTRFPAQYSAVADELGKVAAETGIRLSGVKYDEKDAPIEGLRKLNMEITLSGDYLQEVKFINALERDKMFFLINGIALGEQQGNVRLQLKLETYLRAGAVSS